MKVIIDISEDYYEIIKHDVQSGNDYLPFKLIAKGTSLPTGKWIHKQDDLLDWLQCSECEYSECEYGSKGEIKLGKGTPYCPKCGAKMEVEDER